MNNQMKVTPLVALALASAFIAFPTRSEAETIREITATTRRRAKVLAEGTVKRAITLDHFILYDGTGELLVDASGVKHSITAGQEIVVWGRYRGRSDRDPNVNEIEVIQVAPSGSDDALRMRADHVTTASPPVPAGAPSPTSDTAPTRTERRLRELDELKKKGLVSEDEYRATRQRILGEL